MLHNISIHTSAREVTLHLSQFHSCYLFQSTLLQGKWRIKALKSFSDVISIHTSAREVTGDARWRMQRHGYFNPHFRKGSDGWKSFYKTTTSEFQSTLPQGKWPFQPWRVVTIRYISIHTSAREVTDTAFIPINLLPNFNPHFRKGSDKITVWINTAKHNFNPHFRKGSDLDFFQDSFCLWISIHTSAREVTCLVWNPVSRQWYFNPPFRKGSDRVTEMWNRNKYKFQSTLPQGKWLHNVPVHSYHKDFNPHFRKGSDFHSLWSIYNL